MRILRPDDCIECTLVLRKTFGKLIYSNCFIACFELSNIGLVGALMNDGGPMSKMGLNTNKGSLRQTVDSNTQNKLMIIRNRLNLILFVSGSATATRWRLFSSSSVGKSRNL